MTTSFAQLANKPPPRLLVIGDLILDRYTWGDAERVSPEAPVMVLRVDRREVRLGGAASVAMLLRALGADVTLAGVVGDDSEGRTLQALLDDEKIKVVGKVPAPSQSLRDERGPRHTTMSPELPTAELRPTVLADPSRPTTVKERFIGRAANRHPHQILRVDQETREPIGAVLETILVQAIFDTLGERSLIDAVLISDYAKGVCTPRLLQTVIAAACERDIPVIVDPALVADYACYRGATVLKPNRRQAELATGMKISSPADAFAAATALLQELQIPAAVITLDALGMVVAVELGGGESGDLPSYTHLPTRQRTIYDITGAGDMVLAALGFCVASGMPLKEAARVANVAAGLEVERFGVGPVTRDELQAALVLESLNQGEERRPHSKVGSLSQIVERIAGDRAAGKRIVFTNGCFDLLHRGHLACLHEAAALGGVLIVAVNSDASVRLLKGPSRPVLDENDRAAMLSALSCVDHVIVFDDATPHRLLEAIRPDVLVKGGTTGEIVGREVVEAYGGEVRHVGEAPGISTSHIVSKIGLQTQEKAFRT